MSLSLKVLGERTQNKMIYEFWKPQMFTNTAINSILNSVLLDKEAADPSNVHNMTKYDYYIQQFSEHKNTDSLWSLWIYNNDTNGFFGAFKDLNDNSIIISVYNGTCQRQYYYNNETKTRDWNRLHTVNCEYIPRSRPWFKLASQMANNASSWTDPYLFADDETVGISLVTPIIDNGTLLIILCEMSVGTLSKSVTDTFTSMPVGTILMTATPSLDVIVSSIGEVDIPTVNRSDNKLISENKLISDSINYLRDQKKQSNNDIFEHDVIFNVYNEQNGYYYSIFPFSMLFIDFFSTNPSDNILPDNYQNGFVIIANDSGYLDLINKASNITNIILIIMLVIGFINSCYQSEYYKHKNKGQATRAQLIRINHGKNKIALRLLSTSVEVSSFSLRQSSVETETEQKEESEEKQKYNNERSNISEPNVVQNKQTFSLITHCHCIHCNTGSLLLFTLFQIVLTLLIISITWEYSDTQTKNKLLQDIIPKHEFNEVGDQVHYMFEISDMVELQMAQNYEQMSLSNDSNAMDKWLINMMNSYIRPNSEFTPFMIYYGTPEGLFLGTIRVPNTKGLQHLRRDETTGFDRPFFNVIEGNVPDYNDMLGTQDLYDPRCRPWYVAALDKSYSGTMGTAYPSDSFKNFIYDSKPPSLTLNCDSAKQEAMNLYGINSINSANFTNMTASKFVNNDKYSLVWSRYVFAELTTIGLTASVTVTNDNDEILAVIAIDWVLDSLSQLLVSAVDPPSENNTIKEYSWIFEANANDAAMISSSDMITITDTSQLEGCLTFSGGIDAEQIPFIATQHPTYDILVMSKELINVHSIQSLPINSEISQSVTVPLGLPHLEAGRISYYDIINKSENFNTINVDWVVCRTIDFSTMEVQDIRFTIMLHASIIFAAVLVLKRIANNRSNGSSNNELDDEDELDEQDEEELYFKIMYKMKPIIMDSANAIWRRKYEAYNSLMTTEMTKDFCANRANVFITKTEDKYLFLKCFWETDKYYAPEKIIFHDIVESNLYSVYVLFVVGIHLILSLIEVELILPGLIICVCLEWIDFVCFFSKKYIENSLDQEDLIKLFEITRGFRHKYVDFFKRTNTNGLMSSVYRTLYLIFRGPDSNKIIIHIILLILILFDLILIFTDTTHTFAFYIPILPLLLILRNDQIFNFGKDFVYALWRSKNVLASYAFFIFMISILTISLFGFMTNKDSNNSSHLINSFYSIGEAIVTSFIYMSTAENYNLVYDMFDNDYYKTHPILLNYALSFLILVGMLGTFCFIPLIIHQFEFAFNELEDKHAKKQNFQRTICIIASFIMLDMNNDQGIDTEELKALVNKSILSDKNKVFAVFDHEDQEKDEEDENETDIDLVGFVNYLLAQEFKNSITKTHSPQNKLQSYIECNILRQPQYNTMILILCVMPAYIFSVLKGLNGFSDRSIDYILIVLFCGNFIEINIRWFSWGFSRYWDIKSSPTPNYTLAAINKYYNTQTTITDTNTTNTETNDSLRLSAQEIKWATQNLNEIIPLSIEEKSILSLTHRIDLVTIYFSTIVYLLVNFVYFIQNDINDENNRGFSIYFVQFGILLRTFTLLKSNQILTFSVFTVFPQFVSLIIFLFLYIYWWARLGTILFGNNVTDIVIAEVYDVAPNIAANFNSSGYAILCLIQLLFGEGWHEIMYVQALATTMRLTTYFIIYITVVTIIVSNIFVGLFLAGIDDLDKSHKQQKDLKKLQKCLKSKKLFNKYAHKKIKNIQYQLKQNEQNNKKLNKQLSKLNRLLKQVNGKDFKLPKRKSIE